MVNAFLAAKAFNAAIGACEKGHQWERAVQLLAAMSGCRLRADAITYDSLVSACDRGRQLSRGSAIPAHDVPGTYITRKRP